MFLEVDYPRTGSSLNIGYLLTGRTATRIFSFLDVSEIKAVPPVQLAFVCLEATHISFEVTNNA